MRPNETRSSFRKPIQSPRDSQKDSPLTHEILYLTPLKGKILHYSHSVSCAAQANVVGRRSERQKGSLTEGLTHNEGT